MVHWRQARGKNPRRGPSRNATHCRHATPPPQQQQQPVPPPSTFNVTDSAPMRQRCPVQLQLATASTWWRHFRVFGRHRASVTGTSRWHQNRPQWSVENSREIQNTRIQGGSTSSSLQFFYFVEKKTLFGNCILHNLRDGRPDKENMKQLLTVTWNQHKCDWKKQNKTTTLINDTRAKLLASTSPDHWHFIRHWTHIWLRVTATRTPSDLCSAFLLKWNNKTSLLISGYII